jgi:hypothetical protein
VQALQDGRDPDDPRVGPAAALEWLSDVDDWQRRRLAEESERAGSEKRATNVAT